MSKITYTEAKGYFQKHQTHWEALCNGIKQMREDQISIMKRNINTPNCAEREHLNTVAVGMMIAFDDLLYEFNTDDGEQTVELTKQPNE